MSSPEAFGQVTDRHQTGQRPRSASAMSRAASDGVPDREPSPRRTASSRQASGSHLTVKFTSPPSARTSSGSEYSNRLSRTRAAYAPSNGPIRSRSACKRVRAWRATLAHWSTAAQAWPTRSLHRRQSDPVDEIGLKCPTTRPDGSVDNDRGDRVPVSCFACSSVNTISGMVTSAASIPPHTMAPPPESMPDVLRVQRPGPVRRRSSP